jgi:hypothetical protein
MSLNKEYGEHMNNGVAGLVKHGTYDKATQHVTFNSAELPLPEGVTADSMKTHVNVINELSAQAEAATAQIAREQYANDNSLTTIDGTLNFGGFSINTQHHLQQQVGDEHLWGISTTAVDYIHSDEQAAWLTESRDSSRELAAKLFG